MDQEQNFKTFFYTTEILDQLETPLSRERLRTYLDTAGGDRGKAIRLYVWNTEISAAFYGPLQGLEVVLRNARCAKLYSGSLPTSLRWSATTFWPMRTLS